MGGRVLGFIFTQKCNFRCRHCCNESHPGGSTTMALEEILEHVDEAASGGRFTEIGISGGEPFLFPRHVEQIVAHAQARGLSSSVTSNGFWARDRAHAQAALAPLAAAGLRALNLSISRFHLEFQSAQRLQTAAAAALDLGIAVTVNVVRSADFGLAQARSALGEFADRLDYVVMPTIPSGRAAGDVGARELPAPSQALLGNCHDAFTKLAVTPTGEVFPCCSPGGFTAPLRIGTLAGSTLEQLCEQLDSSTLLRVLDGVGPAFFLPFVERALHRDLTAEGLVDRCHLCHVLMTEEALHAVVEDAIGELTAELAELHLTLTDLDRGRGTARLPVGG